MDKQDMAAVIANLQTKVRLIVAERLKTDQAWGQLMRSRVTDDGDIQVVSDLFVQAVAESILG